MDFCTILRPLSLLVLFALVFIDQTASDHIIQHGKRMVNVRDQATKANQAEIHRRVSYTDNRRETTIDTRRQTDLDTSQSRREARLDHRRDSKLGNRRDTRPDNSRNLRIDNNRREGIQDTDIGNWRRYVRFDVSRRNTRSENEELTQK